MPGAPLSLFISYSRTDSAFVDRLEADLKARSFYVWVDRRKLEGGQDWMDELQNAIDRCHICLVVVSPQAIASKYVRMEYRYAAQQRKLVIPVYCLPTPKVPIDLNSIQWVDFQRSYDQGLADLLVALNRPDTPEIPPLKRLSTQARVTFKIADTNSEPILVTPQPAPPPPNADLNELYRAGVAARAEGNLERTAIFWQQVLARAPHFGNETLKPQMDRLLSELHPIRVQRLRDQAEQAHRAGAWGQEIGAWQALLGLEPKDTQAKERIPVAQHNQKHAWLYENAQEFAKAKNIPALKEQLGLLWHDAPYYGDPAGLARQAGIRVPPGFQEATNAQSKAQAAEAEARRRVEQASEQIAQRKEFVTSSGGLNTRSLAVWVSAFCLLGGVGVSVGALTQSWPLAVGIVAALAMLSDVLGYHRAMALVEMTIILLVSGALVFGITWFLSTFQYDQPQMSNLWFNATRTLTLRHQLIFGAILGAIAGVVLGSFLLYNIFEGRERWTKGFLEWAGILSGFVILVALIVWLVFAALGSIFDWGFGFGYGGAFSLLAGLLAPFLGGTSLFTSISVWWIALKTSPEKIHSALIEQADGAYAQPRRTQPRRDR